LLNLGLCAGVQGDVDDDEEQDEGEARYLRALALAGELKPEATILHDENNSSNRKFEGGFRLQEVNQQLFWGG